MVIRIASIVLRLCGALAVILGILFWSGSALRLIPIHVLLGVVVVLALWIIGIGQAVSSGGSWLFAASALVVGLLLVIVGMTQSSLLVGAFHWVIQVVHLLLGLLAVAIGQIGAVRAAGGSASGQTTHREAERAR